MSVKKEKDTLFASSFVIFLLSSRASQWYKGGYRVYRYALHRSLFKGKVPVVLPVF